jgi:O-antigen ligase
VSEKGKLLDGFIERGIVLITALSLVAGPIAMGAVDHMTQAALAGASLFALLLWVVRLYINRSHKIFWPPISWVVLAFVGYAVIQYFGAEVEYVARKELLRIFTYGIFFLVITNNIHDQSNIRIIVLALVAVGAVISIYAVYQWGTGTDKVLHLYKQSHYIGRGSGTYLCPNHFAGFAEIVFFLGLGYTLFGRLNHVTRILLGYATLMMLAGVIFSMSRGGWVATAFSILAFFLLAVGNRRYRVPVVIGLIVFFAAGGFVFSRMDSMQERFERMAQGGSTDDFSPRLWIWKTAVAMWQEHPWRGLGPGQFDAQFHQFRPREIQWRPLNVHNDYLNTLVDFGAIGFSIVALAWILTAVGAIKAWKYLGRTSNDLGALTSNRFAATAGILGALIAILVHGIVDFNMYIPANALLVVSLLALLTTTFRLATDKYWVRNRILPKILVTVMSIIAAVLVAPEAYKQFREAQALSAVRQYEVATEFQHTSILKSQEIRLEKAKLYEVAHTIEPRNSRTAYEIGEIHRGLSWDGRPKTYEGFAADALTWFKRGIEINPLDRHCHLGLSQTYSHLRDFEAADEAFERTRALDPNNHFVIAFQGWHHYNKRDYPEAKKLFEESLEIQHWDNPIADNYLRYVNRILSEEEI